MKIITVILFLIAIPGISPADPLPIDAKSKTALYELSMYELCKNIIDDNFLTPKNICIRTEQDTRGTRDSCLEWGDKVNKDNYVEILHLQNFPIDICDTYKPSKRQICRNNLDNREKIIECIERGIYDPCEDAGGSVGRSQCIFAHTEIAERRIRKARDKILSLFNEWALQQERRNDFMMSEKEWEQYRDHYCNSTDILANYSLEHSEEPGIAIGSNFGLCYRRVTEKHADELDYAISTLHE